MPNTVIAIKKSATPAAQPTVLANGELAINYADGKLFYKHANGTILPFNTQGGNAFGTINANGTLVVAGTSQDVVSLIAGNNITITGDAINDTITIELRNDLTIPGTAYFKSAGGDEGGELQLANAVTNSVLSGNVVIDVYQNKIRFFEQSGTNRGAFINIASAAAGVGTDLLSPTSSNDTIARTSASAAYDKANSANILAFNTGTGANAFTSATIAGANTAVGTGANAFTSATIAGANTAVGAGANTFANTKLANTSGATFSGYLSIMSGNVGIGISNAATRLNVFGSASGGITTLTDNTSIVVDMTSNNNFSITLGGSNTFINPTTMNPGQSGIIWISQGNVGGRAPSWGSFWKFPSNTAPTLTSTANAIDAIVYAVRNTSSITAQAILNIG